MRTTPAAIQPAAGEIIAHPTTIAAAPAQMTTSATTGP